MKASILLSVAILWAFPAQALKMSREVLKQIPSEYDINAPEHRDAKKELLELVEHCGAGVVEGVADSNSCSFQVKLDDLFFTPIADKTGLLHEKNWAYQDGTAWVEPTETALPESFDLREMMKNGEPEIKKQQCGDCWAWSSHHGLEIARAVHDQEVHDLSIQTILSCSNKGSCNGGYMSAVDFLVHGLPQESEFPYAGSDKSCKFSSSQIQSGWDGKIIAAPYIGSSLQYSRANQLPNGAFREGNKVKKMVDALYQWKSPLVVTVSAYSITGGGIYDDCSAINSGGNHMVAVVGWDSNEGDRIAHVWNSWGQNHGVKGVSRIQWECGDGQLNRGLGVSAKIVQYKTASSCTPAEANQPSHHQAEAGEAIRIGRPQNESVRCAWVPSEGLENANACETVAKPKVTTEYHLTTQSNCGKSSSMTLVRVAGSPKTVRRELVRTAYGDVWTRIR